MTFDRVLTVAQARALDQDAVERLGMPSILLMENAARGVAEAARALGERFVVLCGPGNNGGDGLAAARHLGRAARVHLLAEPDAKKSPDAALQLRILRKAGWPIALGTLPKVGDDGLVWIDALYGTGLQRPLAGDAARWVGAFNEGRGKKLAVDIPSGLDGDTGVALGGIACRCEVTVTFEAPKVGMLAETARPYVGRIVVAKLGLP
jgi:NAD(P)H-hydrate epimerase